MSEDAVAILNRIRKRNAEAVREWRKRHPEKFMELRLRERKRERKISSLLAGEKKRISKFERVKINNRYDMLRIFIYYFYATRYKSEKARKKLEEMGFKLEGDQSKSSI